MRWKLWFSLKSEYKISVIGFIFLLASLILAVEVSLLQQHSVIRAKKIAANVFPTFAITPSPTISPSPSPTPSPLPTRIPMVKTSPTRSALPASSKLLFGIGSQAGPAMDFRIVKEAPVHILSSWYNGPSDLEWMRVQKDDLIPRLYANHYIVHLITWTDLPEEDIQTPHGAACGRPYPVSSQVVEDMKQLAQIYAGNGPMYISLFTEFQSYTCTDNNWISNENYWQTLKDNFRQIKSNFHQYAPQSKVSISWGGWQNRYDDEVNQGGRSLFPHFADILSESDFTSFQTMESDSNVSDILAMTRILGAYGKPVMLSHYKPSNSSEEVFNNDMRALFTDETIQQLKNNGLFAISYMDDELLNHSETSYQLVKNGIQKFGQ